MDENLQSVIDRALRLRLVARLERYPVGARQVGKTTLARQLGALYFDLEQPGDRTRLNVEWDRVCAQRELGGRFHPADVKATRP